MASGDIRYVRAPWGPGQVIEYVDTGEVYNSAPIYKVVAAVDEVESLGLEGVHDSVGYRIAEIERHFHSYERWFGLTGVQNTLAPFVMDSGNNTWGAWIPVLVAGSTPAIAGSVYYDPHRVMVVATERTTVYRIQMGFGASGAAALAAGTYTSFTYISASNQIDSGPIDIHARRQPVGTPCWARCWNASDTGTFSFLVGIHEYEG